MMRVILLSFLVILTLSCRTDYDIEEVASSQYLGEDHDHHGDAAALDDDTHNTESDEHEMSGTDFHEHAPGVRNHGTMWFFDQPWAASFIWGKMIRDTVILLVLSAVVLTLSGLRRKKR